MKHGERGAASLALTRFAEEALQVIFLLNRRYAPYYKWVFRALNTLPLLQKEGRMLESLLCSEITEETLLTVEVIAQAVIHELIKQGMAVDLGDYLEPYAYYLQESIRDHSLRSMPIVIS